MTRRLLPRWLLPLLVVGLVLGHACELSAAVDLAMSSHAAGEPHHHGNGDADESTVHCDPIDALARTGHGAPGPDLAGTLAVPATPHLPARLAVAALAVPKPPPAGPSLFLLHASLLI